MSQFFTDRRCSTQFVQRCKPINHFFDLTCLRINLQNQSTNKPKLQTKLYNQQFVLRMKQNSMIIGHALKKGEISVKFVTE